MEKDKIKKVGPYLLVLFGFIISLLILFFITDSYILPAYVHDVAKVQVPDLIGKKYSESQIILSNMDLNERVILKQYNENYPPDYVINQTPKPGTYVKCGRHIILTISKGGESVQMPKITGQRLRAARVRLLKSGLYIGNITYQYSDSIGIDTVISQSIASYKKISFGSYIDLVVSKGQHAEILIPRLTGLSIGEAEKILNEAGLELGIVSNTYDEIYAATYLSNTIVNQFPPPGELVPKNTKVDITIFRY